MSQRIVNFLNCQTKVETILPRSSTVSPSPGFSQTCNLMSSNRTLHSSPFQWLLCKIAQDWNFTTCQQQIYSSNYSSGLELQISTRWCLQIVDLFLRGCVQAVFVRSTFRRPTTSRTRSPTALQAHCARPVGTMSIMWQKKRLWTIWSNLVPF